MIITAHFMLMIQTLLLTALFWGSFNTALATQLYEIEVEKIIIYQGPSEKQPVIHALYEASDIELLKLKGAWAKVSFKYTDKIIVGWVKKNALLVKKTPQAINQELSKKSNALPKTTGASAFFYENDFGAKVISYDLACVKFTNTHYISGCVANIDVDIKGPVEGNSVTIMCKAEFEMGFEKTKPKQVWEQKVIRTPIKEGIGAVRMQLAVIPLLEKQVTDITMQSHQCRLESVLTTSS